MPLVEQSKKKISEPRYVEMFLKLLFDHDLGSLANIHRSLDWF
jgi:hypothetical protein